MRVSAADIRTALGTVQGADKLGQRTVTITVPVMYTAGANFAMSKKKKVVVNDYDLGPLIDQIEATGWKLADINYVNITGITAEVLNMVDSNSQVRAILLFRK